MQYLGGCFKLLSPNGQKSDDLQGNTASNHQTQTESGINGKKVMPTSLTSIFPGGNLGIMSQTLHSNFLKGKLFSLLM